MEKKPLNFLIIFKINLLFYLFIHGVSAKHFMKLYMLCFCCNCNMFQCVRNNMLHLHGKVQYFPLAYVKYYAFQLHTCMYMRVIAGCDLKRKCEDFSINLYLV